MVSNNFDYREFIKTPEEFFIEAKKPDNKKLYKVQQSDCSFDKDIIQNDISLKKKGPEEDKIFATNATVRLNLRRGYSLLQDIKSKEIYVSRKGLPKFFDLRREFVNSNADSKCIETIKQSGLYAKLAKIILNPVIDALQENKKILIYKLEKANGENAQVSYYKNLDSWIIASKNVSILARNEKDLEFFQYAREQRYSFALLIAYSWFNIIKKLDESQIKSLKEFMDQKTFIGEYCGNQSYQHLVKYNEIDIHFYAIVDNNSQCPCLPVENSFQIFQKFGFTHVKFERFEAENWNQFNVEVAQIYDKVESSSIKQNGEGSVLYFVAIDQQNIQQTISLCKLKTLEYRILRKLREKLKSLLRKDRPITVEKLKKNFYEEVAMLCQFNQPAESIDNYCHLAEFAANYAKKNFTKKDSNIIASKYITFLDQIKQAMKTAKDVDLDFLRQMTADDNQLSEDEEGKSDESQQSDDEKIQKPSKKSKKQQSEEVKQDEFVKQKLVTLIPFILPGSGKSTLFQRFKEKTENISVYIISSQDLLFNINSELSKKKKGKQAKKLYEESLNNFFDQWKNKLAYTIKFIHRAKQTNNILILDTNFSQKFLSQTLDILEKSAQDHSFDNKMVALLPNIEDNQALSTQKFQYPHSLFSLLNCIKRKMDLKQHISINDFLKENENLKDKIEESPTIYINIKYENNIDFQITNCLNLFNKMRNFSFSDHSFTKYTIKDKIKLEFFQDTLKEIDMNTGLYDDILNALQTAPPQDDIQQDRITQYIKRISEYMLKCDIKFDDYNKVEMVERNLQILQKQMEFYFKDDENYDNLGNQDQNN